MTEITKRDFVLSALAVGGMTLLPSHSEALETTVPEMEVVPAPLSSKEFLERYAAEIKVMDEIGQQYGFRTFVGQSIQQPAPHIVLRFFSEKSQIAYEAALNNDLRLKGLSSTITSNTKAPIRHKFDKVVAKWMQARELKQG